MEIDLPERLSGERFDRVVTLLVGVSAVVAALLVGFELSSDRKSQRADAEASRIAVGAFEQLTTASLLAQFESTSIAQAGNHTIDTDIASVVPAGGIAKLFFAAEQRAAARQAAAMERTVGVPFGGSVAATKAALVHRAVQDETALRSTVDRSSRNVDEAERYARRDSRATFALTLLASAGALFGLAGVLRAGTAGWVALGTGAGVLLAAAATGVSALAL